MNGPTSVFTPRHTRSRARLVVLAFAAVAVIGSLATSALFSTSAASVGPILSVNAYVHSPPDVVRDLSGSGNDARFLNFNAPASGFIPADAPGSVPVMRFDGVDDVVVAGDRLASPLASTLMLRFRTTTPSGKMAGFENSATSNGSQIDFHVYLSDDGRLSFGTWMGGPPRNFLLVTCYRRRVAHRGLDYRDRRQFKAPQPVPRRTVGRHSGRTRRRSLLRLLAAGRRQSAQPHAAFHQYLLYRRHQLVQGI